MMDIGKDLAKAYQEGYNTAKAEVAREIFEEIELKLSANDSFEILSDGKGLDYFDAHLEKDIAELKKKYTEGGGAK